MGHPCARVLVRAIDITEAIAPEHCLDAVADSEANGAVAADIALEHDAEIVEPSGHGPGRSCDQRCVFLDDITPSNEAGGSSHRRQVRITRSSVEARKAGTSAFRGNNVVQHLVAITSGRLPEVYPIASVVAAEILNIDAIAVDAITVHN